MGMGQAPETKSEKASANALFVVSYKPDLGKVPIGQMQTWTLHVQTMPGVKWLTPRSPSTGGCPPQARSPDRAPGDQVSRKRRLPSRRPGIPDARVVERDLHHRAGGQQDAVTFNLQLE